MFKSRFAREMVQFNSLTEEVLCGGYYRYRPQQPTLVWFGITGGVGESLLQRAFFYLSGAGGGGGMSRNLCCVIFKAG
jgi:hypothetical protein